MSDAVAWRKKRNIMYVTHLSFKVQVGHHSNQENVLFLIKYGLRHSMTSNARLEIVRKGDFLYTST